MKKLRIRCRMIGCNHRLRRMWCSRCGTHYADCDFIVHGLVFSTRDVLLRWRCYLLGCDDRYTYEGCRRCGHGLYDYEFVHQGLLESPSRRLRRGWTLLKQLTFCRPRCEVCGRRLPILTMDHYICGRRECLDSWVPF